MNPRARYALSPYKKYYKEDKATGALAIGRGALFSLIRGKEEHVQIEDGRCTVLPSRTFRESITLRDYQEGIPELITARENGIIKLSTAYGKTIIALKVVSLLQQKCLVIVKDENIFTQFCHEVSRFFGDDYLGTIKGSSFKVGDITIATIQTLGNRIKEGKLSPDEFGLIIVDECHEFVTAKRAKTIQFFNAKYLYGMTATDRRTDGQGKAIYWLFGEKLVDRKLETVTPSVHIMQCHEHIWVDEYAEMIKNHVSNVNRNVSIVMAIQSEVSQNKKIIVLTKRVEHSQVLAEGLATAGVTGVHIIGSHLKKEDRKDLLLSLRAGSADFNVILGTFSMLSTGVDIPALDTLFIVGDLKSDVLAEQSAGRILRLFAGKTDPRIIDVHDMKNFVLLRQAKERLKFYKSMGWKISPYANK